MFATRGIAVRFFLCALAIAWGASAAVADVKITSDTFGGLRARALGPATPSGRIAALEAVGGRPGDPTTIYVGAASGGVWKSADGGVSFKPIFDDHTQSIGAIRVDPSDPKKIWVGTGETWARNSVSVGDGVWKTTDGGDTWQNMGLKESERIARVQVHPKSGDTVWVCATGQLWSPNEERGVYKTTDGGKTWKKTLSVDADTGCSDLALDSGDPSILYAGMWQFRRRADFFTSGGKGSGLYKSTDGGDTWRKVEKGLPAGDKGRIGLAIAPSRPNVVYAVVEAKKSALYRSDDTGESWREVNASMNVGVRPFYFATVAVDPLDHDVVYKPGLFLTISRDGGKSFSNPIAGFSVGSVHSDHHALWIHPQRPNELLLATDGGLYQSFDRGGHWLWAKNLPIAQFYHVSYDLAVPYNVYGGLQDNGSWVGPSRSVGGIESRDWSNIGQGDGFWAFVDPNDPGFVYSEYQGGNLMRANLATGEVRSIKPYASASEKELRFNWNTPLSFSPHQKGTLYYGAQILFRSPDRGETWERISGDLTTNDPARQQQKKSGGLTLDNSSAEANTTIYAISESPRKAGVIWVGTDDGNVQISRDGGTTWVNLTANLAIAGAPKNGWVSSVVASPTDEAVAFVTVDNHRAGDMKPYAYRTGDYGATWRSVVTPEIEGYVWKLIQDSVNPNLYFLGSEFGLYLSLDAGAQWARFSGDLPKVAVHDLAVHPDGDLLIATHGRGIYVLDDLSALRALDTQTMESDVALLPSRPAEMAVEAQLQDFRGNDEFVGANPSEAATITYWLKKRHLFGDLKVEVYDREGKLITTIPGTKRVGINRVEWPMRLSPPKLPPSTQLVPAFAGPRVEEGAYKIRLIKAKETRDGEVRLVADRRSKQTPEDRLFQQRTALDIYRKLERLTYVSEVVTGARGVLSERAAQLEAGDATRRGFDKLGKDLQAFADSFVATAEGYVAGEERLREKLGNLYGAVNQYEGRPTNSQIGALAELQKEVDRIETQFDRLAAEIRSASAAAEKRKLAPIPTPSFEEWQQKGERGGGGGATAPLDASGERRLLAAFAAVRNALRP